MDTSTILQSVYQALHRLGGTSAGLAVADIDRIRDATGRLDSALWRLAQLKWAQAGEVDVRQAEGDLQVATGRWLEAVANAEKHGQEALVAGLASVVRALIDRRLP